MHDDMMETRDCTIARGEIVLWARVLVTCQPDGFCSVSEVPCLGKQMHMRGMVCTMFRMSPARSWEGRQAHRS